MGEENRVFTIIDGQVEYLDRLVDNNQRLLQLALDIIYRQSDIEKTVEEWLNSDAENKQY